MKPEKRREVGRWLGVEDGASEARGQETRGARLSLSLTLGGWALLCLLIQELGLGPPDSESSFENQVNTPAT